MHILFTISGGYFNNEGQLDLDSMVIVLDSRNKLKYLHIGDNWINMFLAIIKYCQTGSLLFIWD